MSSVQKSAHEAREKYLAEFSKIFAQELGEAYDSAAMNADAVEALRSCIEAGVAVWGYPVVIPND